MPLAVAAVLALQADGPPPSTSIPTASATPPGRASMVSAIHLPTPVPVEAEGVRTTGERTAGRGTAIVPFTGATTSDGGRLVVQLASDSPIAISWRATAVTVHPFQITTEQLVAESPPSARDSAGASVTAAFDGDPPNRIVVRTRGDVPWTLTAALLPRR